MDKRFFLQWTLAEDCLPPHECTKEEFDSRILVLLEAHFAVKKEMKEQCSTRCSRVSTYFIYILESLDPSEDIVIKSSELNKFNVMRNIFSCGEQHPSGDDEYYDLIHSVDFPDEMILDVSQLIAWIIIPAVETNGREVLFNKIQ